MSKIDVVGDLKAAEGFRKVALTACDYLRDISWGGKGPVQREGVNELNLLNVTWRSRGGDRETGHGQGAGDDDGGMVGEPLVL